MFQENKSHPNFPKNEHFLTPDMHTYWHRRDQTSWWILNLVYFYSEAEVNKQLHTKETVLLIFFLFYGELNWSLTHQSKKSFTREKTLNFELTWKDFDTTEFRFPSQRHGIGSFFFYKKITCILDSIVGSNFFLNSLQIRQCKLTLASLEISIPASCCLL